MPMKKIVLLTIGAIATLCLFVNSPAIATPKAPMLATTSFSVIDTELYYNGRMIGSIRDNGDVYINGRNVGRARPDGEIYVNGRRAGQVRSSGEVYQDGRKVGEVRSNGEVYKDGRKVGEIRSNGDIYKDGRNIGRVNHLIKPQWAAVIYFFGFFDL